MKITLINHSSLLFKFKKNFILTDFWNTTPAFGSWLPSALPFFNPTYLASLSFEKNFYLAISHAHDDHIDDYYLKKYFNNNMKIIINEFQSPALEKRLNRLGFQNIIKIPRDKKITFDDFEVISIFDESVSNDDASISFRDKNYCIHHGNDNWFEIKKSNLDKLGDFSKGRKFLYCSQANSASGHPLTYSQYNKNFRQELEKKISILLETALKNVKNLNADYFLPYAGFSKSYVKDKNYHLNSFNPTFANIKKLLNNVKNKDLSKIINIFPGGTFDLNKGTVEYPFDFNPIKLIEITNEYILSENILEKCDTFNPEFNNNNIDEKNIKNYLNKFCDFVYDYLKRFPNYYPSIVTKKICFEIYSKTEQKLMMLDIQNKKILKEDKCNKKFRISAEIFNALYEKKIVFDNLYTGYEAEVMRFPLKEYNKDIIMYLIKFGYKFQKTST